MVNYRLAMAAAAVATLVCAVTAAPAADCEQRHHFDQRQNGSENYRLNIDGVVIAVAPADSLLSAASDIDFSDLFDLDDLEPLKPPASTAKPQDTKPDPSKPEAPLSDVSLNTDEKDQKKDAGHKKQEKAHRLKMRLANMLIPLLRKTRHH